MTILDISEKVDNLQKELTRLKSELSKLKYPEDEIKKITAAAEKEYNLQEGDVYIDSRKGEIVDARKISMFLIYKLTGLGVKRTAFKFKKDPSYINYIRRSLLNLFTSNDDIRNRFINICKELSVNTELVHQMINKP